MKFEKCSNSNGWVYWTENGPITVFKKDGVNGWFLQLPGYRCDHFIKRSSSMVLAEVQAKALRLYAVDLEARAEMMREDAKAILNDHTLNTLG